jgi:hypothetical protein
MLNCCKVLAILVSVLKSLQTHQRWHFPLSLGSFHTTDRWSAILFGDVAGHLLKRALVYGRIKRSGKEEHLLS